MTSSFKLICSFTTDNQTVHLHLFKNVLCSFRGDDDGDSDEDNTSDPNCHLLLPLLQIDIHFTAEWLPGRQRQEKKNTRHLNRLLTSGREMSGEHCGSVARQLFHIGRKRWWTLSHFERHRLNSPRFSPKQCGNQLFVMSQRALMY